MSVGNLQDSGSRSTNFPWQLKMLQGLDGILSAFSSSTTSFLAPQTRVTNIVRSSASGTITAGKYSASFANVSTTTNSTVKGVTLKPGETINFDAGALNNKLDAIAYDGTSSELLIIYIS
jgi:hypothetical protein